MMAVTATTRLQEFLDRLDKLTWCYSRLALLMYHDVTDGLWTIKTVQYNRLFDSLSPGDQIQIMSLEPTDDDAVFDLVFGKQPEDELLRVVQKVDISNEQFVQLERRFPIPAETTHCSFRMLQRQHRRSMNHHRGRRSGRVIQEAKRRSQEDSFFRDRKFRAHSRK